MMEGQESWILWIVLAVIVLIAIGFVLRRRAGKGVLPPEEAAALAPRGEQDVLPVTPMPAAPAVDIPAMPIVEPATTVSEPPPEPAPEPAPEIASAAPPGSSASPAAPAVPPTPVEPPAAGGADDLRRIKGVGPKIVAILQARGVTRYADIAAWTDQDLADINAALGSFAGRPQRDNWVEQARLLAAGDLAGYEAKYGKL